MCNNPQFLYHYTSIKTLAYILKNRTIKFNSLSHVDDLTECQTQDLHDFGKYCYVSCWTDKETEDIPMWIMYAQKGHGIRIRMKCNPFIHMDFNVSDNYIRYPNKGYELDEVIYHPGKTIQNTKINYSDTSEEPSLAIGAKVFVKPPCWNFQNEWRYCLAYIPNINYLDQNVQNKIETINPIWDEIFINLDSSAFETMEILMGPMTDDADNIIVNALLKQYNIKASIRESVFKDKVDLK